MKKQGPDPIGALLDSLGHLSLTEGDYAHIAELVEIQHFKSNAVVLHPGQICKKAYLVVQGGFVCRYFNEHLETPKTINFYLDDLHPFMACVDSYFTQRPTECELRAIADSVVLAMPKTRIDELVKTVPALKAFYEAVVVQALVEENELKLKIIAHSADELYQFLITHFPTVVQKVPAKYIAEFMGISAEWLSKVKKKQK